MKNFRGSTLAAGVGTPESAPHELRRSSFHFFYFDFKHRNYSPFAATTIPPFTIFQKERHEFLGKMAKSLK